MTAKQALRGDIGKLSDEDIAIGIGYQEDEEILIEALVSTGWLDAHPKHRLLIHDWPDHAQDAVHMKLARMKKTFASGAIPKTNRLPKWEREEADKFFSTRTVHDLDTVRTESPSVRTESPSVRTDLDTLTLTSTSTLPRPSPDPPISASLSTSSVCVEANGAGGAKSPHSRFDDWIRIWPRNPNAARARRAFESVWSSETDTAIFACRDRYLASSDAADGICPDPARFLNEQKQNGWNGKWPTRTTSPRSTRKMTPTEEAIAEAKARRMK